MPRRCACTRRAAAIVLPHRCYLRVTCWHCCLYVQRYGTLCCVCLTFARRVGGITTCHRDASTPSLPAARLHHAFHAHRRALPRHVVWFGSLLGFRFSARTAVERCCLRRLVGCTVVNMLRYQFVLRRLRSTAFLPFTRITPLPVL